MAEKRWPQEEKSAHNGYETRPRSLKGRESNDRNPETGAAGKKNEKNSDALDTEGGACCYIRRHLEPGAGSGTPKWEMSAQRTDSHFLDWNCIKAPQPESRHGCSSLLVGSFTQSTPLQEAAG